VSDRAVVIPNADYPLDTQGGSGTPNGALIQKALNDHSGGASNQTNGKVVVANVGGGTVMVEQSFWVPPGMEFECDAKLIPTHDFGFRQVLIYSGGDNRIFARISGPYSSYRPGYGEVPCLMSGVEVAGGSKVDGDFHYLLDGVVLGSGSTNGVDHAFVGTQEGVRANGNYNHFRFKRGQNSGNIGFGKIRTEQQCLAAISVEVGAKIEGSAFRDFLSSYGPCFILCEDGPPIEAGFQKNVFDGVLLESLSHSVFHDERVQLWNWQGSGHAFKDNTIDGCDNFGFQPAGAGIPPGRIQFLDLGGATDGTIQLGLDYGGSVQTTPAFGFGNYTPNPADAAAIARQLLALSNVPTASPNPAGNVVVLPCPGGYRIHLQGAFSAKGVNLLKLTHQLGNFTTPPRVIDAVPWKAYSMTFGGPFSGNDFGGRGIDQLAAAGQWGGVTDMAGGGGNKLGKASGIINAQTGQGDGWVALGVGGLNYCTAGEGWNDDNIECEIATPHTWGGAQLCEKGDVVARILEGNPPDYPGTYDWQGDAARYGAHPYQNRVPWGIALTQSMKAGYPNSIVVAVRGPAPARVLAAWVHATSTAGSPTVTLDSAQAASGLNKGDKLTGPGFPYAKILSVSGATVTLDRPANGGAGSDWFVGYPDIPEGTRVMPDPRDPRCVIAWTAGSPWVGYTLVPSIPGAVDNLPNGAWHQPGSIVFVSPGV
jgi:hypothetical protein